MRNLIVGIAASVLMSSVAGAQTVDSQVTAPIRTFVDTFNKGDAAAAAATHAAGADLVIVDEVAPYLWRGAQAFQEWGAALAAADKKAGISDEKVTIGVPSRIESSGDAAYVIVPAVYTFTQQGKAMQAKAQMTFALRKGATGWLIHGWTWTGPRATPPPAAPAAKK